MCVQVPLRMRVEERNSLNNRFLPDPKILTRAVMQLDDDIIMPCMDIGARCEGIHSQRPCFETPCLCWDEEARV